ncbi:MAG: phage holin family protein [Chlamydiae bacterium]|nr:phage holin family protein [Chlamydiota bacterium]
MGSKIMYYLKSLLFMFFIVFFANHVLPGIDVASQAKLPHLGGDLIFAAALGLINSLIFPILKVMQKVSIWRIALLALVVNFLSYALLKILPVGIHIISFTGYLLAAIVVSLGSFLTNFLEMKHFEPQNCSPTCNSTDPYFPPNTDCKK